MSNVSSPAALPQSIEKLLSERHDHVTAIAVIDATLGRVAVALGSVSLKPAGATPTAAVKKRAPVKVARKVVAKVPAKVVAKAPVAVVAKPRIAKPGMTANEFVLEFVKARKNPTSQEINKHWKDSSRLGMADNNLSILTKAKKLKRTPLGGGVRGSRYSIA